MIERPFGIVPIPDTFDSSMLGDAQSCPRYFYWRHVRHIESAEPSIAPHFGTCMHKALEAHYLLFGRELTVETIMHVLSILLPKGLSEKQAYHEVREAFTEVMKSPDPTYAICMKAFHWHWQGGEGDNIRNINTADELVRRYREKYEREPFELLEPREKYLEIGFLYELFDMIFYYGRIDMIVDWPGYHKVVVDHKTSRNVGKQKYMEFNPFFQGMGYLIAGRHHFPKVGAVCVNVLQTAATKKSLERYIETVTDDHIEAWYNDAIDWVSELIERYEKWRWPRDKGGYGGYCTHWGQCQFRPLCITPEYMKIEDCDRQDPPGSYVESVWEPWESEGEAEKISKEEVAV